MLTILLLGATYAGIRLVAECIDAVRALPRSNDDMVFF